MNPTPAALAALDFVLRSEGGYVNHPSDPGGETNFGISKRAYPSLDIRAMTAEQAREIYLRDYWRPLSLDSIPPALALTVMDAAVNRGVVYAARLLQQVLNHYLPESERLTVDGKIGPRTIAAAHAAGPDAAVRYCMARAAGYVELAGREKFRPFLLGWLRRVVDCAGACDGLA